MRTFGVETVEKQRYKIRTKFLKISSLRAMPALLSQLRTDPGEVSKNSTRRKAAVGR